MQIAIEAASDAEKSKVVLVDLDLVTPFFRSRELIEELTAQGVEVVHPVAFHAGTEFPVMPAGLSQALAAFDVCIVDVGGSEVGARPLASVRQMMQAARAQVMMVVNPFRPKTASCDGIVATYYALEKAAKLPIAGLIANPHLGFKTEADHIRWGLGVVEQAAGQLGIPVIGLGVSAHVLKGQQVSEDLDIASDARDLDFIVINPRLRPDWC